mmetsp:Transcript_22047/g.33001  ORF Transcript_22047/g.33001 Transcript_22047/m.33001 type:complete len:181 (-) Transcript_22047:410-952(-)
MTFVVYLLMFLCFPATAEAFNVCNHHQLHANSLQLSNDDVKSFFFNDRYSTSTLRSSKSEEDTSSNENSDEQIFERAMENHCDDQNEIMDELRWRSMKVNLEEANTRAFQKKIKSRPWKLPYDDARKWVQANLGVDTKEEFFDLVENGNLRTPYIPKEPEKYYTESGTWISWDNFLKEKP